MSITAELLLAALGTGDDDDEEQYTRAMAGAMSLAEGLLELTKIRKLIQKALSK